MLSRFYLFLVKDIPFGVLVSNVSQKKNMVDLDSSELSMVDYVMHHGQFMVKQCQFGISKLLIKS